MALFLIARPVDLDYTRGEECRGQGRRTRASRRISEGPGIFEDWLLPAKATVLYVSSDKGGREIAQSGSSVEGDL